MKNQKIKKSDFEKKMKLRKSQFKKLRMKIVNDVNDFLEDEENQKIGTDNLIEAQDIIKDLIFAGSWVSDRLDDYTGVVGSDTYKKSLTKKIRKALGYTF